MTEADAPAPAGGTAPEAASAPEAAPAPEATPAPEAAPALQAGPVVVVLADDLIWATRLADAVTAAGGQALRRRRVEDLDPAATHVIVDLTARAYDGLSAIRRAAAGGARVVAVGQHDDAALRRAALDAGAARVFTYRALFEGGPKLIAGWLAR